MKVTLAIVEGNVSEAEVDDVTLRRGDDPVDLNQDQVDRLLAAGAELEVDGKRQEAEEDADPEVAQRAQLSGLNLDALKQEAAARNIDVDGKKKAEVIDTIVQHDNAKRQEQG